MEALPGLLSACPEELLVEELSQCFFWVFLGFDQKNFRTFDKKNWAALSVRLSACSNRSFEVKFLNAILFSFLFLFSFWRKYLKLLATNVLLGCWNCVLLVQRYLLREKTFFEKKIMPYYDIFLTLDKTFPEVWRKTCRRFFQNCNFSLQRNSSGKSFIGKEKFLPGFFGLWAKIPGILTKVFRPFWLNVILRVSGKFFKDNFKIPSNNFRNCPEKVLSRIVKTAFCVPSICQNQLSGQNSKTKQLKSRKKVKISQNHRKNH